jgi:acyl-CoA thioester hydrolase
MPRILAEAFTVTPESIDLNGHVNNQEYVRWMQEIATAHSHEQGWTVARYMDTKTTWVIRSHFIEYVRPAFAGDELMVATWVAGMDKQTSPRKYRFVRVRDGKTVVEAETLWVYCDATTGRPIDITPEVCDAFPVVTDTNEIQSAVDDCLSSTR